MTMSHRTRIRLLYTATILAWYGSGFALWAWWGWGEWQWAVLFVVAVLIAVTLTFASVVAHYIAPLQGTIYRTAYQLGFESGRSNRPRLVGEDAPVTVSYIYTAGSKRN